MTVRGAVITLRPVSSVHSPLCQISTRQKRPNQGSNGPLHNHTGTKSPHSLADCRSCTPPIPIPPTQPPAQIPTPTHPILQAQQPPTPGNHPSALIPCNNFVRNL